jgi:hypothetical protein
MLSTVCPRLGRRTLVLAPCERLGDPAREVRYWRIADSSPTQSLKQGTKSQISTIRDDNCALPFALFGEAGRGLDSEALIDSREHLVKPRNHNNLNQSFCAPFSNGANNLQIVRNRLPRHRLRATMR